MPQITISDDIYAKIAEFKQVVESVIEEELQLDVHAELVIDRGIDSILADILGPLDKNVLIRSFQQVGSQYPAQVYGYVAETLRSGTEVQERERLKRQLGFRPLGTDEKYTTEEST